MGSRHPSTTPGLSPSRKQYAYDPGRAKQLLTEAGFVAGPDGILRDPAGKRVELTIMTTAGHALREQIQQIMKDQLRAVGIDLRLDNRPASVFFGVITRRRQFPHMAMYNWNFSPITLWPPLWHSGQIPTSANAFEGSNYAGWRHADNDRLLDQIAEELDGTKRVKLLRRQQEIWSEELPAIPMFFGLGLPDHEESVEEYQTRSLRGDSLQFRAVGMGAVGGRP